MSGDLEPVTRPAPAARPRGAERVIAVRDRIRSRRTSRIVYRAVVGLAGTAVTVLGLVLVPLPGPGWLVVIVGLAILASEFEPARRVLDVVTRHVRAWTHWIARQGWPVRIAVGTATALFVACVLWGVFAVLGVPGWVPDGLVPPLPGLQR
jgi:uncharacterized protein (TIGR02611 family)